MSQLPLQKLQCVYNGYAYRTDFLHFHCNVYVRSKRFIQKGLNKSV